MTDVRRCTKTGLPRWQHKAGYITRGPPIAGLMTVDVLYGASARTQGDIKTSLINLHFIQPMQLTSLQNKIAV